MLEEFLNQQYQDGHKDSQGNFTISDSAARRKMVESGLDTAEKGLLRLVQLGVDSLCQDIKVTILADGVRFHFAYPSRGLLDDPKVGEDLQNAILACVYSGFDYAVFTNFNKSWRFTKKEISRIDRGLEPVGVIIIELLQDSKPKGFWDQMRWLLTTRTQNYLTFLSHLGYCPISLDLDGTKPSTESRTEAGRALEIQLMAPSYLAAQSIKTPFQDSRCVLHFSDDYAKARMENAPTWDTYARFEQFDHILCGPEHKDVEDLQKPVCLGHLYASLSPYRGGFIDVVSLGVLVGRLAWRGAGSVSGVISLGILDTDLSGLALVHNNKVEVVLDSLQHEVKVAAEAALLWASQPGPTVEDCLKKLLRQPTSPS